MTTDTTRPQTVRRCISQCWESLEIFNARKGLLRRLPQVMQRLSFKVVLCSTVLPPWKRIIALQPGLATSALRGQVVA
jgi:hypothetical protein